MINTFMRILEIVPLLEAPVKSSWIMDIARAGQDIVMTLNGRRYLLKNVPLSVFDAWYRSPSKGKFWHKRIRHVYRANPIK